MKAFSAAIAAAMLVGGIGFAAPDARAREPGAREAKPAARTAAPAARQPANATARGAAQRGQNTAQRGQNATQRGQNTARTASIPRPADAAARRGGGRVEQSGRGSGISCVPYARQATGMAISGNGRDWWHNAAGLYDRSNRPEVGSVMAFPGSGGMRSGHVAVVERLVSDREVLIHHANWGGPGIRRGSIMRGVSVIDVSPRNDWTQVRVQVGHSAGNHGRVFPVYGFIHNRPDTTGGAMFARTTPRGGTARAAARGIEEVAQAPRGR